MKLEIKDPCHEDWNKMKIGLNSRHCEVCVKSVIDFTQMNRAQIITYILSNPNEQVCGRMNRDQFDFHHEDIPILIETFKKEKTSNPFLVLALVCLSLSACAQDTPKNIKTPPAVEHSLGQMIAKPNIPADTNKTVKPVRAIKGKVACEPTEVIELQGEIETIEMGDIAAPVDGGISIVEDPRLGPNDTAEEENRVRQFAEKMPEYVGGIEALFDFVQKNLKYPKYEKIKGIQGNVYVRFVVEADGKITRPEILNTVNGSRDFDKEVLRIINMMPKWAPGSNSGKKVPVYMTLPIQFKIK